MSRRLWKHGTATLAMAMLFSACRDASTAPPNSGEETVIISVVGISADAAGVVLRLSGGVERVEAARVSLEVAWASDDATTATVAILGPIANLNELLIVRRRAGAPPLAVQVLDVTDGDGILSVPATTHVRVSGGT